MSDFAKSTHLKVNVVNFLNRLKLLKNNALSFSKKLMLFRFLNFTLPIVNSLILQKVNNIVHNLRLAQSLKQCSRCWKNESLLYSFPMECRGCKRKKYIANHGNILQSVVLNLCCNYWIWLLSTSFNLVWKCNWASLGLLDSSEK